MTYYDLLFKRSYLSGYTSRKMKPFLEKSYILKIGSPCNKKNLSVLGPPRGDWTSIFRA